MMARLGASCLAIAASFSFVPAFGFELDPEYRSLPSSRGFELMDPTRLDSEYQSNVLAYSLSPAMYARLMRDKIGLLASAGSLSSTQFDLKQRAKFETELSDDIRFRFLRTEQENYEEDSSHSILELEGRLFASDWSIAAYGELSRQKKEDNVGFAIQHRMGETQVTRAFVTYVDFTRSERNELGDRFEENPTVYGLLHRAIFDDSFLELYWRRESPLRWKDGTQLYLYENQAFGGTYLRKEGEWAHSLRAHWDRKTTELYSLPTLAPQARSVARERNEVELRSEWMGLSDGSIEGGLAWVARHWSDPVGKRLTHQNLMPFIWYKHRVGPRDSTAEVGWETTFFRAHGDPRLASPTLKWSADESRINARYRYQFSKRGALLLALTFDADGDGGEYFQGGHGEFYVSF